MCAEGFKVIVSCIAGGHTLCNFAKERFSEQEVGARQLKIQSPQAATYVQLSIGYVIFVVVVVVVQIGSSFGFFFSLATIFFAIRILPIVFAILS